MNGTRQPSIVVGEGSDWLEYPSGSYWQARKADGSHTWWVRDPLGMFGRLDNHTVAEHDDGTITVEPSILTQGENTYHGWLRRGVWSEA